jgi:D-alanyl-D-alanine carboxypeptidase
MLHAAEDAGLSPGITSAFRDGYRQSIASGLKAATDRSYHGGSFCGGYGHGLAPDIVSVNGETRIQRSISSENLWKWIDAHGKEFGVGRPYLDRDPAHVAPIDGKKYAAHGGTKALRAVPDLKEHNAMRNDESVKRARSSKVRTI